MKHFMGDIPRKEIEECLLANNTCEDKIFLCSSFSINLSRVLAPIEKNYDTSILVLGSEYKVDPPDQIGHI